MQARAEKINWEIRKDRKKPKLKLTALHFFLFCNVFILTSKIIF